MAMRRSLGMLLYLTLGFSVMSHAAGVISPCTDETQACHYGEADRQRQINESRAAGKQVLFFFGSRDCGPCNSWKKTLNAKTSKWEATLDVVYLPVYARLGANMNDNKSVRQLCRQLRNDYRVSSRFSTRRGNLACKGTPILLLVDAETQRAVDLRSKFKGAAGLVAHVREGQKFIGPQAAPTGPPGPSADPLARE